MPTIVFKIPRPLLALMLYCETRCVFVCCHGEAFDFSKERVRSWAEAAGKDEFIFARRQLAHLVKKVGEAEGNAACQQLFWLRDKDSFLSWLWKCEAVIEEVYDELCESQAAP